MNYSDLSEETKLFLNKAMDIYAVIKDKEITKEVKTLFEIEDYTFAKYYKKILAIFIAGLLVEGYLKEIFSQYDDIKLDDLLEFIEIQESDIKPIVNEKYEEYFHKNFELDLLTIINEAHPFHEINFMTPELIVCSLEHVTLSGSEILEYYGKNMV